MSLESFEVAEFHANAEGMETTVWIGLLAGHSIRICLGGACYPRCAWLRSQCSRPIPRH